MVKSRLSKQLRETVAGPSFQVTSGVVATILVALLVARFTVAAQVVTPGPVEQNFARIQQTSKDERKALQEMAYQLSWLVGQEVDRRTTAAAATGGVAVGVVDGQPVLSGDDAPRVSTDAARFPAVDVAPIKVGVEDESPWLGWWQFVAAALFGLLVVRFVLIRLRDKREDEDSGSLALADRGPNAADLLTAVREAQHDVGAPPCARLQPSSGGDVPTIVASFLTDRQSQLVSALALTVVMTPAADGSWLMQNHAEAGVVARLVVERVDSLPTSGLVTV